MKRTFLSLLIFSLFAASAIAGTPWPGIPFIEVRAYAWPNDEKTVAVILPGMQFKPGVINPEGAVLSPTEVVQLLNAITGRHRDYPVAACFIPHNAFVFYDKEKKPVAYVEVCFACRGIRAQPKGTEIWVDYIAMASIFDAHKLPMGSYPDLASFQREYLGSQK